LGGFFESLWTVSGKRLIRMTEGELGGFGDLRLRRTGVRLLGAMQDAPSMCLHALAEDRNQAIQFGRFLANGAVSADEMLVQPDS